MHGVFQRIGQDCTEGQIGAWKFFSCRNIAYKRQSSVCETGMINGKHRVQHFISGIGGDDRIVICRINFMDVFLCFIRMSVLQLGQNNTQILRMVLQRILRRSQVYVSSIRPFILRQQSVIFPLICRFVS